MITFKLHRARPKVLEDILKNLGVLLAGISGGAVTLIQGARRRRTPHTIKYISGSLFISGFAAWLVSMLTCQFELADGVRMAIAGIAGMSADRFLELIEDRFVKEVSKQ